MGVIGVFSHTKCQKPTAKSVIAVLLLGGPSHYDLCDLNSVFSTVRGFGQFAKVDAKELVVNLSIRRLCVAPDMLLATVEFCSHVGMSTLDAIFFCGSHLIWQGVVP